MLIWRGGGGRFNYLTPRCLCGDTGRAPRCQKAEEEDTCTLSCHTCMKVHSGRRELSRCTVFLVVENGVWVWVGVPGHQSVRISV